MKKLSEFKDDEAMDVLVDLIEPAVNLISDEEFKLAIRGNKEKEIKPNRVKAVQIACREHRQDVVTIMAVLNQTPVEEFHYNALTLPIMLLELFNDKELIAFFKLQAQRNSDKSSGSAMENIEEDQNISSSM